MGIKPQDHLDMLDNLEKLQVVEIVTELDRIVTAVLCCRHCVKKGEYEKLLQFSINLADACKTAESQMMTLLRDVALRRERRDYVTG